MRGYNEEGHKFWEDTKPGWFEVIITIDSNDREEKMIEVIKWLYDNVDKCERHARWTTTISSIKIKFRYERDFIMCTLRWV